MERRAKAELFGQLRRKYEFGVGTIREVAQKFGVHRRLVREAVVHALPPARKKPQRQRPKLDLAIPFIDAILTADRRAPRQQRHTAIGFFIGCRRNCPPAWWRSRPCGSMCGGRSAP